MEVFDICILSIKSDAAVAHRLGKSLQNYRLPANISLSDPAQSYRRILYDCDEIPLDEAWRTKLNASRFLALICSPATRNNPVILERLKSFQETHGKNGVIAVIAAGEPAESFPESFIEKKTVRHILPDLRVIENVETIEPVAADLRSATGKRRREVLKYETVRIAASVLGLHPDDLEQRHRRRRRREAAAVLAVVGAVCLAAAGFFLRLGLIARNEGRIAEEQTKLSVSIAQRTIKELPVTFEGDGQALAYIDEAIENARAGLDELGLGALLDEAERGGGA